MATDVTILFPSIGAIECRFEQRIDRHLQDLVSGSVETAYLTLNERARSQFTLDRRVENIRTTVADRAVDTDTVADIQRYLLDERTGSETAWTRGHLEADRSFDHRADHLETTFYRYFDVVERRLLEWDVDFVFMDFGGEVFRTAVIEAAKRNDIPFVYPKYAPIPGQDCIALLDRLSNVRPELADFRDYELSSDDEAFVDLAADAFTDTGDLFGPSRKPAVTTGKIRGFFETLLNDLRYERFQNEYDSTGYATKRNLLQIGRKHVSGRYRDDADLDERYVFFPLHSPDDAQLTMRAPQYTDQATLAATIAKSLPLGWTLYVKEHPAFVGGYNLETLRRLSAIDNAKLVSPSLNARRLAADADAVVVINSKVGLESLYLDTPVVVLGDPFYSRKGLTADVSDLNELATIFRTLVNQKTTAADEEVLGKLLCRLRDQSYSGKVLRRSDKESQTTKNAQRYAIAISDVLNSKGLLD